MIRVEKLTKVYTSGILKKTFNKAVDGISFEVPEGRTLCTLASRVAENQRFP